MKTAIFSILLFSIFSANLCFAQRDITINNKVNHSELYDSFKSAKRSIDTKSINLTINGIEIKDLKRKKYIKPFEESNIFLFEKKDGINRTTVLISAEKTLIYEYQNSFNARTEISKNGFKHKKKKGLDRRSTTEKILEVGYSYDQSLEQTDPSGWEENLLVVIEETSMIYNNIEDGYADDAIFMAHLTPIKLMISPGAFANNSIILPQLANIWKNKICYNVDAAHHITSFPSAPPGHSNSSHMCNLSNDNFTTSYSSHPSSGFTEDRVAHELGHTIGASHENEINESDCFGSTTYFMCE